jgi:hypothetical protein
MDAFIQRAISDLLRDEPLQVRWTRQAALDVNEILTAAASDGGNTEGARVWIDLATPGEARIYLANATSTRFAFRKVAFTLFDEAARETIAQLVRSALVTLLNSKIASLSRTDMAVKLKTESRLGASDTVAATGRARFPAIRREWQLAYAVRDFAPRLAALHGAETQLAVGPGTVRGRWWPAVWLSAGYALPASFEDSTASVTTALSAWSLRAGAAIEMNALSWLRVRCDVGGGVDSLGITPRTDRPDVYQLRSRQSVVLRAGRAAVVLAVPLRGRWAVFLSARVEALSSLRLHLQDDSQGRAVLASHRLQSSAALGVLWRS